jgi:hypothetical protein
MNLRRSVGRRLRIRGEHKEEEIYEFLAEENTKKKRRTWEVEASAENS